MNPLECDEFCHEVFEPVSTKCFYLCFELDTGNPQLLRFQFIGISIYWGFDKISIHLELLRYEFHTSAPVSKRMTHLDEIFLIGDAT